jgi:ATP-binding cassette subfamily F protein 3
MLLEEKMNSSGFFDDPEQGLLAGEEHARLTTELDNLYQQWEAVTD